MSGIEDEDGVELASNLSSRKNARNIFIPVQQQSVKCRSHDTKLIQHNTATDFNNVSV